MLKIFLKAVRLMIKNKLKSLLYEYQEYIKTRADTETVKYFLMEIFDEIIQEYINEKKL